LFSVIAKLSKKIVYKKYSKIGKLTPHYYYGRVILQNPITYSKTNILRGKGSRVLELKLGMRIALMVGLSVFV